MISSYTKKNITNLFRIKCSSPSTNDGTPAPSKLACTNIGAQYLENGAPLSEMTETLAQALRRQKWVGAGEI